MVETNGKAMGTVLDNPIRLKLYLYLRKQQNPVGIRETQRALNIPSPSTVSWHFDKLVEHNYIIKTRDNRYFADETKKIDDNIAIQVSFTVKFFRDRLVTPLSFIFYFLVTMIVISVFVWINFSNPLFIGLQGFFSLLVSAASTFYIWKQVQTEIKQLQLPEKIEIN